MNNPMSRAPVLARHALVLATVSLLSLSVQAANLTRDNGAAVGDNQNSQTAGANGPVLLQDVQLIQKLQRFDRERIPERVVHARGTGAHGTFTVTDNLSDLTKAKVFAAGEATRYSCGSRRWYTAITPRKPCATSAASPPSSTTPWCARCAPSACCPGNREESCNECCHPPQPPALR